ncbi:hypothetical protein ACF0H5_008117 [Mactra antiquata]
MESITVPLLIVLSYCSFCDGLDEVDGYFSWSRGNRTELYCPDICLSNEYPDQCCSCNGRRCWDTIADKCPLEDTQLEYLDIFEQITNELNYTVLEHHGPGDISLESTNIGSFINFSTIGVKDYAELGLHFSGHIQVDEASIQCDCSLYPLVALTNDFLIDIWPNLNFGFICEGPDVMKGKDLKMAYDDGDFDDLTCDISDNSDCPSYYCNCIEQPSQNKIIVNCTAVGFKFLPLTMPIGSWGLNKIDLILANNDIRKIDNRDYLSRLVNLDLRGNVVTDFDENAAKELTATVNIEDQRLQTLPLALRNKDPNDYRFGEHPVLCDCSNIWIGDWIRFGNGYHRLNCVVLDFASPAENVYSSTLDCNAYDKLTGSALTVIIGSIIAVLILFIIIILMCFHFRYELMLLRRRMRKRQDIENPNTQMYDVFISFYTENPTVFKSVRRYLRPTLIKSGYSVFIPCLDIILGEVDQETIEAVHRSKTFVIVMCDNYAINFESNIEFESIWEHFVNDNSKFIIVIDFDSVKSRSVKDRRLRALQKSWYCPDFSETNSRLISRLIKLIGPPRQKAEQCDAREADIDKDTEDAGKADANTHVISRNYAGSENDDSFMNTRYKTPNVFGKIPRPKQDTYI